MPEYGFFLTCVFPYMDRIFDSVLISENTDQRKPVEVIQNMRTGL